MDGEVRKHSREIRDIQGKLANHQCNANNQTAQKKYRLTRKGDETPCNDDRKYGAKFRQYKEG